MPAPCGLSAVRASREACRTTSWFESTQVLGAPTSPNALSDSVMMRLSAGAFQSVNM